MNRDNQDNRHQSHRHYPIRFVGLSVALAAAGASSCVSDQRGADDPNAASAVKQGALQSSGSGAHGRSRFLEFHAPAGDQPTTLATTIDGRSGAILPNGRFVTPAGIEVNVGAPKPFGLALSPDEQTAGHDQQRRVALLGHADPQPARRHARPSRPSARRDLHGRRVLARRRALLRVGRRERQHLGRRHRHRPIIGSVNLNGAAHPLDRARCRRPPTPPRHFKGAFPGNMVLSRDGRYLYVVDQGSFQVFTIDTHEDRHRRRRRRQRRRARQLRRGRRPRRRPGAIRSASACRADERTLLVTNVGVFQYTHLRPPAPTGDRNGDYPLCIPGVGYPDEIETPKTIQIKKIDAQHHQRPADDAARSRRASAAATSRPTSRYTIPALGSPNVPESSSVYVMRRRRPGGAVAARRSCSTGLAVGEHEDGIAAYGGSHPNAVVAGGNRIYVSNGNNDSISDAERRERAASVGDISLSVLRRRRRAPQGRAAGVARARRPDRRYALRRRGRAERGGRDQPASGEPRVVGPHPDRLVAVQRQGEPRRRAPVRGQRQGARRRAEPRTTWRRSTR